MNPPFPILPEATRMSVMAALRLHAWATVAVGAAFVSRACLTWVPGPDRALRTAVALLPLLPAVLYLRTVWHWMRSLDELQRRLQMEAVCFGTLGMLFISLIADLLRSAGVGFGPNLGWEGYFAFTFFLYAVGLTRANRRFR